MRQLWVVRDFSDAIHECAISALYIQWATLDLLTIRDVES